MLEALTRRRLRMRGLALPLALLALAAGCDDGETAAGDAGPEPLPEYTAGNLGKNQRGLTLDADDLILIPSGSGNTTVDATYLQDRFGLLVLNEPYHQDPTGCPSVNEAPRYQPKASAEAFFANARYPTSQLDFDRIAVNVDLLNPTRTDLLSTCQPGATVRFDLGVHREQIIQAFRDLASLDKVAYITVGLDMNRYYHVLVDGERRQDDYSNWVTLYREVYDAIKAVNPDIKVGPGISWNVLLLETAPEMVTEYGLGTLGAGRSVPPALLKEAVTLAARRTVWPLLNTGRAPNQVPKADFLALGMVQNPNLAPFNGSPEPTDAEAALRHFVNAPIVANGLPIVLPQIDWETQSGANAVNKATFLTLVKKALSHTEIEWAAWRRFSDIPELTGGANPCGKYTQRIDPTLNYPVDYCYSGLLNTTGQVRQVFTVLTQNP